MNLNNQTLKEYGIFLIGNFITIIFNIFVFYMISKYDNRSEFFDIGSSISYYISYIILSGYGILMIILPVFSQKFHQSYKISFIILLVSGGILSIISYRSFTPIAPLFMIFLITPLIFTFLCAWKFNSIIWTK